MFVLNCLLLFEGKSFFGKKHLKLHRFCVLTLNEKTTFMHPSLEYILATDISDTFCSCLSDFMLAGYLEILLYHSIIVYFLCILECRNV